MNTWYGCIVCPEKYAQIQQQIAKSIKGCESTNQSLVVPHSSFVAPVYWGAHIVMHPMESGIFDCQTAAIVADRLRYLDELIPVSKWIPEVI